MKPAPAPFSVRDALQRSLAAFEKPPLLAHIERPKPVGQCLIRFAVPLRLCQTTNRTRHGHSWKLGQVKRECLSLMRAQLRTPQALPLGGRPQVLAVRFSSTEPDAYSDWAKVPVDCLKKLGLIVDDAPKFISLSQWWEPAAPKTGFCVLEIWSGAAIT